MGSVAESKYRVCMWLRRFSHCVLSRPRLCLNSKCICVVRANTETEYWRLVMRCLQFACVCVCVWRLPNSCIPWHALDTELITIIITKPWNAHLHQIDHEKLALIAHVIIYFVQFIPHHFSWLCWAVTTPYSCMLCTIYGRRRERVAWRTIKTRRNHLMQTVKSMHPVRSECVNSVRCCCVRSRVETYIYWSEIFVSHVQSVSDNVRLAFEFWRSILASNKSGSKTKIKALSAYVSSGCSAVSNTSK